MRFSQHLALIILVAIVSLFLTARFARDDKKWKDDFWTYYFITTTLFSVIGELVIWSARTLFNL